MAKKKNFFFFFFFFFGGGGEGGGGGEMVAQCFRTASSTGSLKVGIKWEKFLMSLCDNFDQVFVNSSRPTKEHPILYQPIYKKKEKLTPSQFLVFMTLRLIRQKKKWERKKFIVKSSLFLHNVFLPCRSRSMTFLLTLPTLICLQPLLIWTSLKFCLQKV